MIAKERVEMIGYWLCKTDKRYFLCDMDMKLVCEESDYVWEHNTITKEKDIEVGEFEIICSPSTFYLITRNSFNADLAAILDKYDVHFSLHTTTDENTFETELAVMLNIGSYLNRWQFKGREADNMEITKEYILRDK